MLLGYRKTKRCVCNGIYGGPKNPEVVLEIFKVSTDINNNNSCKTKYVLTYNLNMC